MFRSLLAWAALLTLSAGLAQGNYIILRVNMGLRPPPIKGEDGAVVEEKKEEKKAEGPEKPLTVVVFVEYTKAKAIQSNASFIIPEGWSITDTYHKWGRTYLLHDGKHLQVAAPIKRETVFQTFDRKRKELTSAKERDKLPGRLKEVAEFALTNGLLPQFVTTMDEIIKLDPKEPALVSVVKAYQQVRNELKKPIERDDAAIAWKAHLNCKETRSEHYVLLYDSTDPSAGNEVRTRLDRLERNMEAFYYWFALKGRALPVPEVRLVAVLLEKPADFKNHHQALGSVPLVADGFYARRDNLVVFSTERLDAPSQAVYRRITERITAGWDFKKLMNPKVPPPQGKHPMEIAYAHTLALVKKCLDEESEIATASHQGTRQLLAALGLLPRAVEMPEWIQFGFPSFFETPKFDPYTQAGAFWPGTGAPSWVYLVQFQLWQREKQLDPPEQAIRKVLTDAYFRGGKDSRDEEAGIRGRTMSWALTYFLAQRHLDELLAFGQELSRLPRDLEFDGDVHLGCFARAFKLADPKQPDGIDQAKLDALARDWYSFIGLTPIPVAELFQEAQRAARERRGKMPGN